MERKKFTNFLCKEKSDSLIIFILIVKRILLKFQKFKFIEIIFKEYKKDG
jgi:hypothetical protein